MRLRLLLLPAFFSIVACSSSSSSPPPPPSDSGASDAPSDANGDAADSAPADSGVAEETGDAAGDVPGEDATNQSDGGCNNIPNQALLVTEDYQAQNLPAITGGLVANGSYTLTSYTHYTGPGGKTGQGTKTFIDTILISGTSIQIVAADDGAFGVAETAQFVTSGTKLEWQVLCPTSVPAITWSYSADPTKLVLIDDTQKLAITYTKKNFTGP